jgi:DNA-binding Xre family transcriptional regulator
MHLIDGKIRLTELAKELGVTGQALRNHLKNSSGLGVGAVKFGSGMTDDYLLPIDSVFNYIEWAMSHSKKIKYSTLEKVEKELGCLRKA